jgi:putative Mn2+ efflux pump MntP
LWAVIVVAVGLAMDAVAVCIAAATAGHASNKRAVFRLAFHFGLFQFVMPVVGWFFGSLVDRYVKGLDHWIAFALLAFVGGRMVWAAFHSGETAQRTDPTRGWTLLMLSTATSLDALAVGMSLALAGISVWYPSLLIGFITAGLCLLAIVLGNRLRAVFTRWAEIVGGVVLIAIGVWILVGHK